MGTKNLNSATNLITFTRASGGTALRRVGYGPELVTNGTFDTDITGWNTGFTSGDGVVGWSNGGATLTSTKNYSADKSSIRQVLNLPAGRYLLSFEAASTDASFAWALVGTSPGSGSISGNGWWPAGGNGVAEKLVYHTGGDVHFEIRVSGTTIIDNISIIQVVYDVATDPLVLYNHPINTPRINHNADGTAKGLLIEEARTNLVTHSEDFSNSSWIKEFMTTTVSGSVASPSGLFDAYSVVGNASKSAADSYVHANLTLAAGTNTVSCFVKSKGYNVLINSGLFTGDKRATFDFATETFSYVGSGVISTSSETLPDGWYRIEVTFTHSSDSIYEYLITPVNGTNATGSSYNGTDGIYLWGAQMEAGAFPTSYIPTSGSTATRAVDVAFIPVSDFGYNQKAGTVLVEFKSNKPLSEQFGAFVLHDGTPNNRIMHMAVPNHRGYVKTDSGTQADIAGGNRGATSELVKFAMAFAENDFAASAGGSSPSFDLSGTVPSGITRLALGNWYQSFLGSYLNGHIKSMKYYPRRLSNAQLQELTT